MILPDVNVLLYAFRRDSPRHAEYRRWLEALVNAQAAYGIAPQVLASVIRISTHARIYAQPSTLDEAIKFCRILLAPDTCTGAVFDSPLTRVRVRASGSLPANTMHLHHF